MIPVVQKSSLIQSIDEPNVLYAICPAIREDFDLDVGHGQQSIRMTPARHFTDRGAPCVEYRSADWIADREFRIRIYWWGTQTKACGKCATCSCKKGEDTGV